MTSEKTGKMLTLYHNAASTCSQKVRWVFAEKGMDFESREIDLLAGDQHQDWYAAINPMHVVPSLVDGDAVILESSLIIRYLDDLQPGLIPDAPLARYQMNKWIHRIDKEVHPVAAIVTFALGPRRLINSQPEDVREASINKIVDPDARARRRSVLDHGIEAPEFKQALASFVKMLDDMEATLEGGTWLAGSDMTLADGAVLPYVLRLSHLGMDPLIDRHPAVATWFAQMQTRPSFETSIKQWLPDEIVALMRTNGEEEWPGIATLLASEVSASQEVA